MKRIIVAELVAGAAVRSPRSSVCRPSDVMVDCKQCCPARLRVVRILVVVVPLLTKKRLCAAAAAGCMPTTRAAKGQRTADLEAV